MLNALTSKLSTSHISSSYQISNTLTATAGPWKIYPAKRKSTGKEYSVFVFDKKSLDAHSKDIGRSGAAQYKRAVEEVVERLKKEASSLARLRHPGVLELVEPVEETRGGGLQFVAEPVTASLSSLLQEKDEQERGSGFGGRASRYVTEDSNGTRRRRELEIDELEIQKGLLQVSKALQFLHENAGLIHGNLTPDAILINAKSDWKLSGLAFCGPPEPKTVATTIPQISLNEVLQPDPRLPPSVQLNLDYTSPDFVLDNNLTTFADMFSLGLLCIALYNSPHRSPIECHHSLSAYKRAFGSSSSVPSTTNNFMSSRPIPKELANYVLPRLLTRRPAQRMTAKEFEQSEYFNNILVSTIRFLDTFPAKAPNEKTAFLRGLIKVLPSFPKSVMEKKVLPALLEEMKDKELISLILHNAFKIIELLPSGKRAFSEKIRPRLKEIFVGHVKQPEEKDPARDAGLLIVIEQLAVIANNCSGKEFKDDVLPIIFTALQSPTPPLINAALTSLPTILPVLDFSTIKNELFPVIAAIFSKTNSLAIKIRGLEAFVTLCGGSNDPSSDDGLDGLSSEKKKGTSSTALDKFTMQEKIVPLISAIKTREPAVMMAALKVLAVVGKVADADFVATIILPLLWSMSLGPQLNLKEFQEFMTLIKSLSSRVEEEQTKKLQELTGGNSMSPGLKDDFMSFGTVPGSSLDANGTTESDFEALVKGGVGGGGPSSSNNPLDSGGWDTTTPAVARAVSPISSAGAARKSTPTATFSWSSPPAAAPARPVQQQFRTVTPDLASIQPMAPTVTQFSQPLQPQSSSTTSPQSTSTISWGAAGSVSNSNNIWATPSSTQSTTSAFGSLSLGQQQQQQQQKPTFGIPPPPSNTGSGVSGFSLAPPPGASQSQRPLQPQQSTSFGGLSNSSGNLNSLASLAAANRSTTTSSGSGMGMGMGVGSMGGGGGGMSMGMMSSNNNNSSSRSMGNTMNNNGGMSSMNSMMGGGMGMGMSMSMGGQQQQQQQQKGGLDKYESLL